MAKSPKRKPQSNNPMSSGSKKPELSRKSTLSTSQSPKTVVTSNQDSTIAPRVVATDGSELLGKATSPINAKAITQSEGLIHFDRRLRILCISCVSLFFLLVFARIHYSSIPLWNQVIPDGSDLKRGLIQGTPHYIRLDEWGVLVPEILSQANLNFPIENPGIGAGATALIASLPVKHPIVLTRPECWGYLLFGPEMGLAWWWNYRYIFGFLGATFLFLLLTRNKFWLSAFGGFWLTFSSGVVWWSMFPTTLTIACSFSVVLFCELLYTQSRRKALLLSIPLSFFALIVALTLYPAWQIPLGYLFLALCVGYIWKNGVTAIRIELPTKLAGLGISAILIAVVGYIYYEDAKATVQIIQQTVYPGRRFDSGGDGFIANMFSEYYSWMLSDTKLPTTWNNICEASHFLTFTPIIFLCLVFHAIRFRRLDPMLIAVAGIVAFYTLYIEVGIPTWLASTTLLGSTTEARLQIPLGFGSVILTMLYLNFLIDENPVSKLTETIIGVLAVLLIMGYAAYLNVADSAGFFKTYQLIIPTLFFIGLNLLLLPGFNFRYRAVIFAGALALFILPNIGVNPVAIGLAPITENPIYKSIAEQHQKDPDARWMVFGAQPITFMAMATGINQISGLKSQPDLKTMRVFDPTTKNDSAYNRYARPIYFSYVTGTDSVLFNGSIFDSYAIGLDPCSPRLKKLNVKYIVFDRAPQPVEVRCMKQVSKIGNIEIYRIND